MTGIQAGLYITTVGKAYKKINWHKLVIYLFFIRKKDFHTTIRNLVLYEIRREEGEIGGR